MTITTKHNPGDTVYYMSDNKIIEDKIVALHSIKYNYHHNPPIQIIRYVTDRISEILEDKLFESKADIISHLLGTEL